MTETTLFLLNPDPTAFLPSIPNRNQATSLEHKALVMHDPCLYDELLRAVRNRAQFPAEKVIGSIVGILGNRF